VTVAAGWDWGSSAEKVLSPTPQGLLGIDLGRSLCAAGVEGTGPSPHLSLSPLSGPAYG
jgi:hypothetical protein